MHANALGGFLKAQRATRSHEVSHAKLKITRSTDQLTKATVDIQHHFAGAACENIEWRFIQVGQLLVSIARGTTHKVDGHFQVLCTGGHAGHTHHGHLCCCGLHGNPAAWPAAFVQQSQTKFNFAQRKTHGTGVGVVVERDEAITVGVAPVRTAYAGKTAQTSTTNADHIGHDFFTIGQHDALT